MNNNNIEITNFTQKNIKIDYSGLTILFGLGLQAVALIPLIARISLVKSAEEISFLTPILFLFTFIMFSVIAFTKKYYIPLIIFFIGIATSSVLLAQKFMYERSKEKKTQGPLFK